MDRMNYFEMLDLDFDPVRLSTDEIKDVIEEWRKSLNEKKATESTFDERAFIDKESSAYKDMVRILGTPRTMRAEANALKAKRVKQIEQLIDIMLIDHREKPLVTQSMIRLIGQKTRLSAETVRQTFIKKGYEIITPAGLNIEYLFLNDLINNRIIKLITQMHTMQIDSFENSSMVNNLYDLACYFCGEDNTVKFHKKSTADLCSIMEVGVAKYNGYLKEEGQLMADLFSTAKTQVFDTEEHRKRYDRSLEKNELKEFFDLVKLAPTAFKKEPWFAENCIKTIQKRFPDYNLALALYNSGAGIKQDPYEPVEALIHVSCANCRSTKAFTSREEAEKAKCPVCGAPFYIQCPKCKRMVPASADRCPNRDCNFLLLEIQFFEEYLRTAEFALKEFDLEEARKFCNKAENASPGDLRVSSLKDKIGKYQRSINELDSLISEKKYVEANIHLNKLYRSMPKLKLDKQSSIISLKLSEAQDHMPSSLLSKIERINRCVEVLEIVKDYQPAIEMLRTLRPEKPLSLAASSRESFPVSCLLSWRATGEKSVTYDIVRKENGIPCNQIDGKVIAKNISDLQFEDSTLQTGKCYGYAVFARRQNAVSEPATCEIIVAGDLNPEQVRVSTDINTCNFSWELPANCIGIRVLRRINGVPEEKPTSGTAVFTTGASSYFRDTSVANNCSYGYRLQCIYPYKNGVKYSTGITRLINFERPPAAMKNISAETRGHTATVRWDIPDNIQRKVQITNVMPSASKYIGQILPISSINKIIGKGITYADTVSDAKHAQFTIPGNSRLSLAVISIAGIMGIISDIVDVCSADKCEIDRNKTQVINNNTLMIVLKHKPDYLKKIHYICAKKKDDIVPWATIEDAKASRLKTITIDEYVKDGMILENNIPSTNIYISIIGQYEFSDGGVAFSEPSRLCVNNNPKCKISYKFEWKTAGKCKLIINTNAKEIPDLYVVYRTDGHIPFELDDPQNVQLHKIERRENDFSNGRYIYTFPNEIWDSIPSGTFLRLFAQKNKRELYDIEIENPLSCKVP